MMAILTNKCFICRPHFLVMAVTALLSHMTSAASTSDGDIRDIRVVGQAVQSAGNTPARLDVGISVNTKVRNKSGTDMEAAFRETEALLIGQRLRGELERNDDWGVIRLFPEPSVIPQLTVQLSILASDGRELVVETLVRAVTGETMWSSVYRDISVNDDYTDDKTDPFADLYVTMVNDIVHSVSSAPHEETYLRTLSSLRYASELVPEAFPDYLGQEGGLYIVRREPSREDPMLIRLNRLQDYELLFVDTIDEQLANVSREVSDAYYLWMKSSKEQLDWLDLRRERGVSAETLRNESTFTRLQAVYAAHRSLKIHEQELFELVLELENETRATAVYADEQVFKLSGTLEQQYQEWRATLRRINDLESTL
jgi:hypothetical protein